MEGCAEVERTVGAMLERAFRGAAAALIAGLAFVPCAFAAAETIHVDSRWGRDSNPGTAESPLQTLRKAAEKANAKSEPGPMTIRLQPGLYTLPEAVIFENRRAFGRDERLTIEAAMLPDDAKWLPSRMPVLLSTRDPRESSEIEKATQTYGLKVRMSHVTVRGLKFLGNPMPNNWHCALECVSEGLRDVLVTQCVFAGNRDTLDIYCAVITDGSEFVVDHCVFLGCHACVVFWDGGRGAVGTGNAMRHCIVDGARISGVWTCGTAEDLAFHNNIVTRSAYFWMRARGEPRSYRVRDCVVTDNGQFSGYGVESGPTGPTGPEITFVTEGIIRDGTVVVEKNPRSRRYLHVPPGAVGSELRAGLFKEE